MEKPVPFLLDQDLYGHINDLLMTIIRRLAEDNVLVTVNEKKHVVALGK